MTLLQSYIRAIQKADVTSTCPLDGVLWGKMSVAELPPISGSSSKARTGSGRSRRSSTHSQSSRLGVSNGETTEITPLNGFTDTPRSNMTKRSNKSPGSTGGSSGQGHSAGTSPRASGNINEPTNTRSKTLTGSDSGSNLNGLVSGKGDSGKLETLFEQKTHHWPATTTSQDVRSRRVSDNTMPTALQQSKRNSDSSGSVFPRTKSFTNLTKVSDNSKSGAQNSSSQNQTQGKSRLMSLQRVSSEQNLSCKVNNAQNGSHANRTNIRRRNLSTNNATVQNITNQKQELKPMRTSKSTPNFTSASQVVATQSQSKMTVANSQLDPDTTSLNEQAFGDPEDEEREQRIIDWLIGVESEEAERPPSPCIIEEEPAQTDTAIHIVYGGE